jgi:hypothetical protein
MSSNATRDKATGMSPDMLRKVKKLLAAGDTVRLCMYVCKHGHEYFKLVQDGDHTTYMYIFSSVRLLCMCACMY